MNSRSELRRLASQNPDALIEEIERLRSENAHLTDEYARDMKDLTIERQAGAMRSMSEEIIRLIAQLNIAKEALRYYADEKNWCETFSVSGAVKQAFIETKIGEKARAALTSL